MTAMKLMDFVGGKVEEVCQGGHCSAVNKDYKMREKPRACIQWRREGDGL